jgi:hypothetical protein
MSEPENSPQDEGKVNDEKKLRKRERKLRERLREAKRAQADALEYLRHAEARMRKRMARVQELEDRLDAVHQRLGALQVKGSTVITMIATGAKVLIGAPSAQKAALEVDRSEVSELLEVERISVEDVPIEEVFIDSEPENEDEVSGDDVVMQARKARAVAEIAEEAVRDAVERVTEVEKNIEQFEAARHLVQEAERLQAEADKATEMAREAQEAVRAAERLVKSQREEEQQGIAVVPSIVDEERMEPISEMDRDDVVASNEPDRHPSPLEVAQVEEIEEEEDTLETVAAMIIADAAGIAAARAEAVAEACSARTREARTLALKADQALEAVRVAISNQKLSGEGAEIALKAAEREATHTHAVLADAEAAEERALNAAMNAEAEAEVAEGMAFAASDRDERDEKRRDEVSASYDTALPSSTEQSVNDDDDEDTLKVPVIRPQQE